MCVQLVVAHEYGAAMLSHRHSQRNCSIHDCYIFYTYMPRVSIQRGAAHGLRHSRRLLLP